MVQWKIHTAGCDSIELAVKSAINYASKFVVLFVMMLCLPEVNDIVSGC